MDAPMPPRRAERVAADLRSRCRYLRGRRRPCRPHGGAARRRGSAPASPCSKAAMSAGMRPAIKLGTVMPGFGVPLGDLIERIGFEDARELWALSKQGADYVRANATEELMPGIAPQRRRAGSFQRRRRRQVDQPAADARRGFRHRSRGLAGRPRARRAQDPALFPRRVLSQGVPDRRPPICPWPRRAGATGRRADLRGHAGRQHRCVGDSQAHRHAVGAACARRISCSPATSISARRCGGCRKRCCRSGAMRR